MTSSAYPEHLHHRTREWSVRLTPTQLQIQDPSVPGGRVVYRRSVDGPGEGPKRASVVSEDVWPARLPMHVEGTRAVKDWILEAWSSSMQSSRQQAVRDQRVERQTRRVHELKHALRALAACALLDDDATMLAAARCYKSRMQACIDHFDPLPDFVEMIH